MRPRPETMAAIREGEARWTAEQLAVAQRFKAMGASVFATVLGTERGLETWVNIGVPPHVAKELAEHIKANWPEGYDYHDGDPNEGGAS